MSVNDIMQALIVLEEEYDRLDALLLAMPYLEQCQCVEGMQIQGLSMAIRYLEGRLKS